MLGDEFEDLASAILSGLLLDKITIRNGYIQDLPVQFTSFGNLRLKVLELNW